MCVISDFTDEGTETPRSSDLSLCLVVGLELEPKAVASQPSALSTALTLQSPSSPEARRGNMKQ